MERNPADIEADPHLRAPFCEQESLDEFTERMISVLEGAGDLPDTLLKIREILRSAIPEQIRAELFPLWYKRLDGETNVTEALYLQGYTSRTSRLAILDRQFAETKEAARGVGIIPPDDDTRLPS